MCRYRPTPGDEKDDRFMYNHCNSVSRVVWHCIVLQLNLERLEGLESC